MTGIRIAGDIGGTFTDIACLHSDGRRVTHKVASTPHNYAAAIVDTMAGLAADDPSDEPYAEIRHALTVATNAILEGKGAKSALSTKRSFRDVLELRRIRVPHLNEPLYEKPGPLVPRLRAALPDWFISVSHEVLPGIREYERPSTSVANAYIGPPVAR